MKILYLLASLLLLAEVYGDMELDDDDDNYDDDNINGTLLTHNLDFDDALFDKDQAFEFDWKYFEWQFIEFKITIPSETKTFCAPELVLLDQCFDEDKKPLQAKKLTKCMADIYSKMEEGGKVRKRENACCVGRCSTTCVVD